VGQVQKPLEPVHSPLVADAESVRPTSQLCRPSRPLAAMPRPAIRWIDAPTVDQGLHLPSSPNQSLS
jgi:hypothetical protein